MTQNSTSPSQPSPSVAPVPLADTGVERLRNLSPKGIYQGARNTRAGDLPDEIESHNTVRVDARVKIYKSLFPYAPASIADIGCGIGLTADALKRAYPQAAVFGVDTSEDAIDYATRAYGRSVSFAAMTVDADSKLSQPVDAMVFQEFYPFTRTADFTFHRQFLTFMNQNLSENGFGVIQLAVRHVHETILACMTELQEFCDETGLTLVRRSIPYDRFVDMTGSVMMARLISPAISMVTGADKRDVLMLYRNRKSG